LLASLPPAEKGVQYLVSTGTLAQAVRGDFATLARYPLTLNAAPRTGEAPVSFAFARVGAGRPPGEAAAYWRGEYLGSGQSAGAGTGEFSLAK